MPVRCPVCATDWCDARGCLDEWFDPWWDERERRIPVDAAGNQKPWWNWPTALRAELFASWEAILVTTGRWALQGCVEFLRAEWITDATIIRASGTTRSTRSSSSSV